MALRTFENLAPSLALDANALAGLKQQARAAPEKALAAAATQFEALFMQMLLKSMREALPQDGPLSSETTKMVTGMFDQQLAQQLASKGLGIADMMVKQLSRGVAKSAGGDDAAKPLSTDGAADFPVKRLRLESLTPPNGAGAADSPSKAVAASVTGAIKDFVDKLRPQAEAAARAAGLPVTFLLAQAGLETGWGRHQPRAADGAPSHNLFGIKAGKSWNGPAVEATTTEHVAGATVKSVERFRSYSSYAESMQDFARLVRRNPRYASAVTDATNADAYAQGMQKAGYATDPNYAAKLARAIRMVAQHGANASASAGAIQVVPRPADSAASGGTRADKA